MYEKIAKELVKFIDKSPSCYHVIQNFSQMLEGCGYQQLREEESWELLAGGKYYLTRNGSSLITFQIPDKKFQNFQIVASHSDSPSFKIKENEEMVIDSHYVTLNVEKYGGMICAPWFDRPLSVAGRVMVRTPEGVETKLVYVNRDLLLIPNLAIHMNNKINDGYSYNPQKDMIPLYGEEHAKGTFRKLIAKTAGVKVQDLISTDLFLYNRVQGTVWGAKNEFVSATKIDDLQCAYTTMMGFLEGGNPNSVSVCCIFDNEEVGSSTKQGAASTMLQDTLQRICISCGRDMEEYRMLLASSFMLSADNAHAVHPNHLDKADPTNRPYMNHGVVIKYSANQKYTTDSVSAAIFKEICKRIGVPVQDYANRSNIPGGSTLGSIATTQVPVNTVDVGLAQLAMHSPYETAGVKDTVYMIQATKAFFNTWIQKTGDGTYRLH